ncbi:hypothetical protein E4T81_09145 [Barnesiella sp. WM24]|uniref:hypothetical protein n=1 Tax=Barnesiella sp. WM24 TaxID=2558278 RepID=UPI001071C993|nr:hypothetical protein [Barnesiella sp. WM24]TFU93119.1 hypothetical protein E4T81_09145 [Barnesiella sp. WM24]
MRYNIFKSLLACGALMAFASCSENSWNDEYLDDFETETPSVYPDKQSAEYELLAKDYKTIASLQENIDKATAAGVLEQLEAVGANGYFNDAISPAEYLPAFLNSVKANTNYPLYYLNPKSSLRVIFKSGAAQPAEVTDIEKAPAYTVTTADYQSVWGSDEDYAESFAPSRKPAKFVPAMLSAAYPNAAEGDFAYVTYNMASQDPVFGGSAPAGPAFEQTSVAATVELTKTYTISGIVTGLCAQGLMITDLSGTVFVYKGSSFDISAYSINEQLTVTGKGAQYSGGMQISSPEFESAGIAADPYVYPSVTPLTDAEWEADFAVFKAANQAKEGAFPIYAEVDVEITKSEKNDKGSIYLNYKVGSSLVEGAIYQATDAQMNALTVGKKCRLAGYLMSCSTSGNGRLNMLLVSVDGVPEFGGSAAKAPVRKVATLASEVESEVYAYNGSAWTPAENVVVVQASDYAAMGVSNFSSSNVATYVPEFLKQEFPYASADDVKYVVCKYYDSSSKETIAQHCERAVFDGTVWTVNTIETLSDKFALNGSTWVYDPSVTIDLPRNGKPQISVDFYQACVNWVYNNIDVPQFGSEDIKSGKGYVTSYGNNEYYSGASAYQCDVDLRPSEAKKQCPAGWEGKSDEQILADMKSHFEKEVCPAVLHELYPDQMPGNGVDLYYYINFIGYTVEDGNVEYTATYLVTAKGEFKYISCTWNDAE